MEDTIVQGGASPNHTQISQTQSTKFTIHTTHGVKTSKARRITTHIVRKLNRHVTSLSILKLVHVGGLDRRNRDVTLVRNGGDEQSGPRSGLRTLMMTDMAQRW